MVLCFQIIFYMFSLKGIYHFFVWNFWCWIANLIYRMIGYDDTKTLNFHEQKLLKCLPPSLTKTEKVVIGNGLIKIWTISVQPRQSSETPIVLLHSLGYGASFWLLNLQELSKSRAVYAIDLLGFGKSSKTPFSTRLTDIETEFVEFLEAWRIKMDLEIFILLGHGFGGYISFLYAATFPSRVRHLVFVEPWGFNVDPKHYKKFLSFQSPKFPLTNTAKLAAYFICSLNKFSLLRFVGPGWGLDLVKKFRGDLIKIFTNIPGNDTVANYLYYWNVLLPPTGEAAFHRLSHFSGYARHPLLFRVNFISKNLPMTFVIGSRSTYVGHDIGNRVKQLRNGSYVDVQVVNGAGHYIFVEKSELFNQLVNLICLRVDNELDSAEEMKRLKFRSKRSDSSPSLLESPQMPSTPFLSLSSNVLKCRYRKISAGLPEDILEESDKECNDDDDDQVPMLHDQPRDVSLFLCGDSF